MYKNILTNLFNFCHLVNDEKISDNFLNAKTADEIHFFESLSWRPCLHLLGLSLSWGFKIRINIKNPSNFSKWWPCKSYLQVKSSFIFYFTAVRTQKPEEKATQNKNKKRCYCKLHSLIAYWNIICMEFTFNFLITIKWYRFKLYVGTRSKKPPENMCHKFESEIKQHATNTYVSMSTETVQIYRTILLME